MKRPPYLIQRLQKPFPKLDNDNPKSPMMEALGNAFSFGGGLVNGGISKDAMKLLKDVWRYDYMGSAEFEWGAVPESLSFIATNTSKYVKGEIEVTGKYKSWDKSGDMEEKAPVYFVCIKEDEKEVCEWIKKFADDTKNTYQTKESIMLAGSICKHKYNIDNVGWHDIDNHYLFFTDKTMFENFCKLLGIK